MCYTRQPQDVAFLGGQRLSGLTKALALFNYRGGKRDGKIHIIIGPGDDKFEGDSF